MWWKRWLAVCSLGAAVMSPGCASEAAPPDLERGTTQQAVGETITTDKTNYTVGENVVLTYAGLPGNYYDWVALSPVGSPATEYTRWLYTLGQVSGMQVFTGPPAGQYVARVYENNTFTVLATSAPITIAPQVAMTTVMTDQPTYQPSATATVTYAGMAGYSQDWISIAPVGAPATGYVRWGYTGGLLSGSIPFLLNGLNGQYVARAHFNNGYGIAAESAPFTVAASGTTITRDKASYAFGENVTITYTNMQGSQLDWVSVAPQGSPATWFNTWWEYTEAKFNGTIQLTTLPPGTYVARAYFNDGYDIEAESAVFTVAAPVNLPATLTTAKAAYTGLETVTVNFAGMSGDPKDWIGAYEAQADMRRFRGWTYTGGGAAGSIAMPPLYQGTWVLRAFFNDSFKMEGQSAAITISTAVATDKASYTAAEPVNVQFGGMAGFVRDWVGISAPGAPASSFYLYAYTSGVAGGTKTFDVSSLGPGTYVARAYFNDTLTLEAESAPFTVTP